MRVRTRQPESPIFQRQDAFTFRSYLCLRCSANYRCVSGSRVGLGRAEYVLSLKHLTPQTESMQAGTEKHAEFSRDLIEPRALGENLYRSMLRNGETVTLKEAMSCVMKGYSGKLDVLRIRREEGGEYFVDIQENKSHPAGGEWFIKWMLQLALYGYVYSHTDMAYIHADERHWWPVYLPEDSEPVINVRAYLHYLDGTRPDHPDGWFCRRNKIEESWMLPWVQLMKKRASEKWPLHRRGLYVIDVPDEPDPLFFGKRKVLVKDPPRLGARSNFE